MPIKEQTDKKPVKYSEKNRKVSPNHIAYNALIDEGVKPMEACRMLGISATTAMRARRHREIWDVNKDSLLRSSVKAVQKLVKGEPFGTIEKVRDSTALAAAGMVLDREVPKVNLTQSLNMTVNIDPIDIAAFCSMPEVIEVSK